MGGLSGIYFIRALISLMGIIDLCPNYLPKTLSENMITLGIMFQQNFKGVQIFSL